MASDAAPESTLPYPPLHKDKKFVVLSDWDGTITTRDSNDYLTDELGFGREKRRELNELILAGERTFRDAFREDLESVVAKGHSFEYCKEELVKHIILDSGFQEFNRYCDSTGIPVVIISSGMAPLIRAVLSNLVGEEDASKIDIVSNEIIIHPDGKWEIQYRHPSSGFGHDKSQAILPYRRLPNPPTIFFFGDGVSDMSAARHADVLFVKQKADGENDLHKYCVQQGIPHILFSNFKDALKIVRQVVEGKLTVKEALAIGQA
ncbi:HAD-like domain-containing protein [Fomitopsis serialis]|uniref:HAD-like domain-containing protein n=1 Tax=Fomitopsis serialis TaxID=139415 RepID=UPI00200834F5|nr:HAD-like domain-containing protein [Neoantrodia serialis]KAH9933028.1 HAD-like domain-containing protein [Neoantrodia serialis]